MKQCNKCNKEKDLEYFSIRKDTGKIRNTCNTCRAECVKRTRKNKPDVSTIINKKKYNQKFIRRVKILKGCYICGIKHSECLDLHHVNMQDKEYEPAAMSGKSLTTIKNELKKCIVLCSNHHRMVHSGRITLDLNQKKS